MTTIGLAARAAFRSFAVRSVILAALTLTAINVYAGHAHATICDPLEPCARSVLAYGGAGWADPTSPDCAIAPITSHHTDPPSVRVPSRDDPAHDPLIGGDDVQSDDLLCQPDRTGGTAGSLVEGVAVSPGFCAAQAGTGHAANYQPDEPAIPTSINASIGGPQVADVEEAAVQAVTCATHANDRQGRSYYVPRSKYYCDPPYHNCDSANWKGGSLAYRLDNTIYVYSGSHCGGWGDDDCLNDMEVHDSRNRIYREQDPTFTNGCMGYGECDTQWSARKGPLQPYCKVEFDSSATFYCSSYWYDN